MLHSEIKRTEGTESRVSMRVEGNPLQVFTELFAMCWAVAKSLPTEEAREDFIDDLPEMIRNYRLALTREIEFDSGTIEKAKGE